MSEESERVQRDGRRHGWVFSALARNTANHNPVVLVKARDRFR